MTWHILLENINQDRESVMRNDFKTQGDTTIIFVRDGSLGFFECLIDTEDLDLVSRGCDTSWHMSDNGKGKKYVTGSKKTDGKSRTVKLHRIVMRAPKGKVVDHIEGNTLDNRKHMLRVVTQVENMQNSRKSKNNKSGVRGLYFHSRDNRWIGGIWANKRYYHIGTWKPEEFEVAKAGMEEAYKNLHKYVQEVQNNVTSN